MDPHKKIPETPDSKTCTEWSDSGINNEIPWGAENWNCGQETLDCGQRGCGWPKNNGPSSLSNLFSFFPYSGNVQGAYEGSMLQENIQQILCHREPCPRSDEGSSFLQECSFRPNKLFPDCRMEHWGIELLVGLAGDWNWGSTVGCDFRGRTRQLKIS